MILYVDASALVKLYVDEAYSDLVHQWVEAAHAIATSRVAYVEAVAAMARRRREGSLDADGRALAVESLTGDWPHFALVEVDELAAGEMATKYPLRGLDAIHLAAAAEVYHASAGAQVAFATFDARQGAAARAEGLTVLPSEV
jgi:uncharacterized protein